VESVKAASDVYLPVAGDVTEANEELEANPSLVNESPMNDGWFVKIAIPEGTSFDDLMDEAAYKAYLETLAN
jgi:glycine cleavage system H protein